MIEIPEKLLSCYRKVKQQLISRGKPDDKAEEIARATCAKTTGLKWTQHNAAEGDLCPIVEVAAIQTEQGGRYRYYAGIAIVPTISKNKFNYRAEELEKAYPSLEAQKVFENHDYFKPPIGKVVFSGLTEKKEIIYVMEVDESVSPETAASIESGYIDKVSVGANAKEYFCDICDDVSENCNHWRGMKYKIKGKEVECTITPRGITFHELTVVYFKPGIEQATINQTSEKLPVLIEKYNENELLRKQKMSEQDELIKVKTKLERTNEDFESEKLKTQKLLAEQKTLKDQIAEVTKHKGSLEMKILTNKIKELAKKEIIAYPERYTIDNMPKRLDEIKEKYPTVDAIEIRMDAIDEKIAETPAKEEGVIKEFGGSPSGRGSVLPPSKTQFSELKKKLERKRTIELALNITKPINKQFKEWCIEHSFIFGQIQGIEKRS